MIVTWKHGDFLNGGLFQKSIVLFFRGSLSVGLKINSLRKKGFPMFKQKSTQICRKIC